MIEKYSLIGRTIKIVDSRNKSLIGLSGRVIDETKNLLTIEIGKETGESNHKKTKKIIKNQVTISKL